MSVLYEITIELRCNEIKTVEQLEVSIAKKLFHGFYFITSQLHGYFIQHGHYSIVCW